MDSSKGLEDQGTRQGQVATLTAQLLQLWPQATPEATLRRELATLLLEDPEQRLRLSHLESLLQLRLKGTFSSAKLHLTLADPKCARYFALDWAGKGDGRCRIVRLGLAELQRAAGATGAAGSPSQKQQQQQQQEGQQQQGLQQGLAVQSSPAPGSRGAATGPMPQGQQQELPARAHSGDQAAEPPAPAQVNSAQQEVHGDAATAALSPSMFTGSTQAPITSGPGRPGTDAAALEDSTAAAVWQPRVGTCQEAATLPGAASHMTDDSVFVHAAAVAAAASCNTSGVAPARAVGAPATAFCGGRPAGSSSTDSGTAGFTSWPGPNGGTPVSSGAFLSSLSMFGDGFHATGLPSHQPALAVPIESTHANDMPDTVEPSGFSPMASGFGLADVLSSSYGSKSTADRGISNTAAGNFGPQQLFLDPMFGSAACAAPTRNHAALHPGAGTAAAAAAASEHASLGSYQLGAPVSAAHQQFAVRGGAAGAGVPMHYGSPLQTALAAASAATSSAPVPKHIASCWDAGEGTLPGAVLVGRQPEGVLLGGMVDLHMQHKGRESSGSDSLFAMDGTAGEQAGSCGYAAALVAEAVLLDAELETCDMQVASSCGSDPSSCINLGSASLPHATQLLQQQQQSLLVPSQELPSPSSVAGSEDAGLQPVPALGVIGQPVFQAAPDAAAAVEQLQQQPQELGVLIEPGSCARAAAHGARTSAGVVGLEASLQAAAPRTPPPPLASASLEAPPMAAGAAMAPVADVATAAPQQLGTALAAGLAAKPEPIPAPAGAAAVASELEVGKLSGTPPRLTGWASVAARDPPKQGKPVPAPATRSAPAPKDYTGSGQNGKHTSHQFGSRTSATSADPAKVLSKLPARVRAEVESMVDSYEGVLKLEDFDEGVIHQLNSKASEDSAVAAVRHISNYDIASIKHMAAYINHIIKHFNPAAEPGATPTGGASSVGAYGGQIRLASVPVSTKAMLAKLPLRVYRRLEEVVSACSYLEWNHFDAGVVKVLAQLSKLAEEDVFDELELLFTTDLSNVEYMPAFLNKRLNNRLWARRKAEQA